MSTVRSEQRLRLCIPPRHGQQSKWALPNVLDSGSAEEVIVSNLGEQTHGCDRGDSMDKGGFGLNIEEIK